jgi:hypothetical protein
MLLRPVTVVEMGHIYMEPFYCAADHLLLASRRHFADRYDNTI